MAQQIIMETRLARGGPGHCFWLQPLPRSQATVRIVEEWLRPDELTRDHHASLGEALKTGLEQLRITLRQKEVEARRTARPDRMALAQAMGRPTDWNANRQAVSQVVQKLGAIDSVLRMLPLFGQGMELDRAQMELRRCHAPVEMNLAPKNLVIAGAKVDPGTVLHLLASPASEGILTIVVEGHQLRRRNGHAELTHSCREPQTGAQHHVSSIEVGHALSGASSSLFMDKEDALRASEDAPSSNPMSP